jgi:hypothetical protein
LSDFRQLRLGLFRETYRPSDGIVGVQESAALLEILLVVEVEVKTFKGYSFVERALFEDVELESCFAARIPG